MARRGGIQGPENGLKAPSRVERGGGACGAPAAVRGHTHDAVGGVAAHHRDVVQHGLAESGQASERAGGRVRERPQGRGAGSAVAGSGPVSTLCGRRSRLRGAAWGAGAPRACSCARAGGPAHRGLQVEAHGDLLHQLGPERALRVDHRSLRVGVEQMLGWLWRRRRVTQRRLCCVQRARAYAA